MPEVFTDKLKDRLILAGLKELEEHGIKDFSLRRVATSAEVSCAAPYRHFKDKEQLIDAIIEYVKEGWMVLCAQINEVFSDNLAKLSENTYLDFCKEYPNISVELFKSGGIFHDRYIILDYDTADEKVFLCGGSSKDAGGKITSILEDKDRNKYQGMIQDLLKNPVLILK